MRSEYDYLIVGAGLFGARLPVLLKGRGGGAWLSTSVLMLGEISIARR